MKFILNCVKFIPEFHFSSNNAHSAHNAHIASTGYLSLILCHNSMEHFEKDVLLPRFEEGVTLLKNFTVKNTPQRCFPPEGHPESIRGGN